MREAKIVIVVSSACSALAIIACLMLIPYRMVKEIGDELLNEVQIFRFETDSAWSELMDIQISFIPPGRQRDNPFNSIFRRKRQDYSNLPPYCICQIPEPVCPPGPAGPPGPPGQKGRMFSFVAFPML
uniref:Col_cuticle_N domain-containing protein n=1 Tax=Elaeophora elaphi TaxID=1147741 RepID=A0A0R3RPS3_9BILA